MFDWFRTLRWRWTRSQYWTFTGDGVKWFDFRSLKEALDAACEQVRAGGHRPDIHLMWWWDGDNWGRKPGWVSQTAVEGQEVYEYAMGLRSR